MASILDDPGVQAVYLDGKLVWERYVMTGWQPIETAPMDGRPIILFNDQWDVKSLGGGWDAHEKAWRVAGFGCPHLQPTMWHPFPPWPKAIPEPPNVT